jgi:predicted amidohydrolase YtcJ
MDEADLIVRNARVTTLHSDSPEAEAFAVRGEKFLAVGSEAEVMRLAGDGTRLVDAGGRRLIPGLNDSHLHAIRVACSTTWSCGGTGWARCNAAWR